MIQKIPYPCLLSQHTISKPPTSSRAGKRGWSWQQPFRDLFHTFFSLPAIHIPGTSRGFPKTRGRLVLLCSESPYEIPKPWAEASFSSWKLLLYLCPFTAFTLWAGFAAAVNPKPGCPLSNSSCHSPATGSWNWLSGTSQGLCLPKCVLVSAIDFFSLIWVCFECVCPSPPSIYCAEGLRLKWSAQWFFFFWKFCHELSLIVPFLFDFKTSCFFSVNCVDTRAIETIVSYHKIKLRMYRRVHSTFLWPSVLPHSAMSML